ncbi:hypothetical protein N7520_002448 [Penicillium odoratum]|uniref:uncharacterized protein n=1 Tax=Penicillium odoratum TaxID=1167516 RepID=UPI002548539C|nr:uncharacterized protein N7520_002448 [Penicillium odoratum]KAJ5771919.1 hypothetical protein N7520_002448 [Penicillium odoratum]
MGFGERGTTSGYSKTKETLWKYRVGECLRVELGQRSGAKHWQIVRISVGEVGQDDYDENTHPTIENPISFTIEGNFPTSDDLDNTYKIVGSVAQSGGWAEISNYSFQGVDMGSFYGRIYDGFTIEGCPRKDYGRLQITLRNGIEVHYSLEVGNWSISEKFLET